MSAGRVPGKASSAGSSRTKWEALALQKFGIQPSQLSSIWVDFESGAGLAAPTTSGTVAQGASPSLDGGWLAYTVGDGTLAGRVQVRLASVVAQVPIHFANMKTSTWMMGWRGKLTTAPGANGRAVVANGSVNVYAGINKALNATKFVGLPGSGTIVSSVSFDTSTHEVMFRHDPVGALCYLSVDGEAEVSGSNAGLPTSADQLEFDLNTNAAEAAQTLNLDYFFLMSVRS